MRDALTFEFDQLQPGSAVVELEWERVAVPFTVSVDVHALAAASLRRQLRTLSRYTWMSWNDAATYLLAEHVDLDAALAYADTSTENENRYDNEMTKSNVLVALNRQTEAVAAQNKALDLGTPLQVHQFARQLLTAKHTDEAFAIFRRNATKHPDQWFVHDGLARAYSAQGKFGDAEKEMHAALAAAPSSEKGALDALARQLAARQDISK